MMAGFDKEGKGMTRAEKIEWLKAATDEQVVRQHRSALIKAVCGKSIAETMEGNEDLELAEAELVRRMKR